MQTKQIVQYADNKIELNWIELNWIGTQLNNGPRNSHVDPITVHEIATSHSISRKLSYAAIRGRAFGRDFGLSKQKRVNMFTHFGVTTGITQGFRVIPEVTPKWVNNTNVHSNFTLISLFSKIHSLKSEHIHSFLFRE